MIIQSGFSRLIIAEHIVEANSDITEEEIIQLLFRQFQIKRDLSLIVRDLSQFFLNKSKEESLDSYKECYINLIADIMNVVHYIHYNLNINKAYRNNVLRFNQMKLLPSSDLIFTTDHDTIQADSNN